MRLKINYTYQVMKRFLPITTDAYLKDLFLFSSNSDFKPLNNYLDLEAGKTVKIKMISTKTPISVVQYISLFEAQN